VQILRKGNQLAGETQGILPSESLGNSGNENQGNHAGVRKVHDANHQRLEGQAVPCDRCGAVIHWWDRYGGGPHCHRCRDWPSWAVVARIAAAESTAWLTLWPLGGSEGPNVASSSPNAACGHRRGRKLVIWPTAILDERLVGDPGRSAEAEEFFECANCGTWILEI
jgi:hypothetical protein